MIFKSKYNKGDKVYILVNNKVFKTIILDICIDNSIVKYKLKENNFYGYYSESVIFKTKEELLASL